MGRILREIKKHVQIYILFVKFSVMSQMEYRSNFIGNMAMETGYLFVKLSYAVVVFRAGTEIKGPRGPASGGLCGPRSRGTRP